ncbi:MAG: FUSC family protein [Ilumatobacteraceae bacterium]
MADGTPLTVAKALVLLLALVVVPAVLVAFVAGSIAVSAFPVGLLGGLLLTKGEGRRLAPQFTAALPIAAAVSSLTAGTWWWVALFAVLGAVAGALSSAGRALPMVQVSLIAATAPQIRTLGGLLVYVAFLVLGAMFGTLLARRAGAPADTVPHPAAPLPVASTALFGATVFAVGAAISVAVGGDHSFWYLVMVLVLLQLVIVDARSGRVAAAQRVVGTFVGVLAAVPLAAVLPAGLNVAVAIVLVAVGISQPPQRYWLASAAISAAVLVVSAPDGDSLALGTRRVLATVLAFVLLAVALGGLHRTRGWRSAFQAGSESRSRTA